MGQRVRRRAVRLFCPKEARPLQVFISRHGATAQAALMTDEEGGAVGRVGHGARPDVPR